MTKDWIFSTYQHLSWVFLPCNWSYCPLGHILLTAYVSLSVLEDEPPSIGLPKLSVKFFLHASGDIASKFSYDQVVPLPACRMFIFITCESSFSYALCFILYKVLVAAFRKIPKATWNAKERFPLSLSHINFMVISYITSDYDCMFCTFAGTMESVGCGCSRYLPCHQPKKSLVRYLVTMLRW